MLVVWLRESERLENVRDAPDPIVACPSDLPTIFVSCFWSARRSWNLPDVVPFIEVWGEA